MKPNILLITTDQHHYSAVGYMNNILKTPNIDRIANEGMCFERAYCPNPTCTPTRASIITGKYPSQHGAWSLGTKLPETEPTIGNYLKKAGYSTALVGKAHFQPLHSTEEYSSIESYPLLQDLDYWRGFYGPFYGFDHIELARNHTNEANVGQHYAAWMEDNGLTNWKDYFSVPTGNMPRQKNPIGCWDIPEEFHCNTWIAERSNALLDKYKDNDEPFLLWASFFDPHYPHIVPSPWDKMYSPDDITLPKTYPDEHDHNPPYFKKALEKNPDFSEYRETGMFIHGLQSNIFDEMEMKHQTAVYYGMVSFMDKYIGKILDKLDELGLTDNTLVIFTTDHGDFLGHHGLRYKCVYHYEDLLRIPMAVRYPKVIPSGVRSDSLQSLVDYSPTVLSFCGLDIPRDMTGVNQKDVWTGQVDHLRKNVIIENRHEPTTMNMRTYVDHRYKLTVHCGREYGEMYDLENDPGEFNNLWDDPGYKDLKVELLLKYTAAELEKEPMWMPRIFHA